jgi:hypothetical protein
VVDLEGFSGGFRSHLFPVRETESDPTVFRYIALLSSFVSMIRPPMPTQTRAVRMAGHPFLIEGRD